MAFASQLRRCDDFLGYGYRYGGCDECVKAGRCLVDEVKANEPSAGESE
jgi:hypothetical protein